jgi:hypothetical protein
MQCACGYQFALDPKKDKYTDNKIVVAARKASLDGERYFTVRQLATTILAMRGSARRHIIWGIIFGIAAAIVTALGIWFFTIFFGFASLNQFFHGFVGIHQFDYEQFSEALEKYLAKKKTPPRLLRNDRPLAKPPPEFDDSDLYDYGVEGILITARPLLVDMLVLNQFHTTQKVVVIDQSGYPEYLVPRVNQILNAQPTLRVFALHDATNSGAMMVRELRSSKVFDLKDREIVDLGISKRDLSQLRRLKRFARQDGGVAVDHIRFEKLTTALGVAMTADTADRLVQHLTVADSEASLLSFG